MFPSHERCPGWCTDRRHIVTIQYDALIGQFIDVWSGDLGRTVKAYVIPAQVVSNDHDDIRLRLLFLCSGHCHEHANQKERK